MNVKRRLKQRFRAAVGERGRTLMTRTSYALGWRPRVNPAPSGSMRYPEGRRAAVVISADLELAWAWRYARRVKDPLAFARSRARQGRRNFESLLQMLDEFELPVTWATVGHLLLDACAPSDRLPHPDIPRVCHFENEYWAYRTGDWFDADPGSLSRSDPNWPDWYGPDLVQMIRQRTTRHEIGCHTFSHVVLSDDYCGAKVATAELRQCQVAAARLGLTLRSLAFPGNLAGNFESLREAGVAVCRWHGPYELDTPRRDAYGIWRLPGGVCLEKPYATWTVAEQTRYLRRYLEVALEHGLVCSFWFHPETDPEQVHEVFPAIFAEVAARRSEVWVGTMADLATWLDSQDTAECARA